MVMKNSGLLSVFVVLSLMQMSDADIVVAVDMDPLTAGGQSSIALSPGQIFSVQIVAQLTGATSLSAYGVSVQFDTNELNLSGSPSATELLPSQDIDGSVLTPGAFVANITPGAVEAEDIGGGLGQISTIEAVTFGSGPSAPNTFVLGSILFEASNVMGDLTDVDIVPGLFNVGVDAFNDNFGNLITPTFVGGSTVAIPEPRSFLCALVAWAIVPIFLSLRSLFVATS